MVTRLEFPIYIAFLSPLKIDFVSPNSADPNGNAFLCGISSWSSLFVIVPVNLGKHCFQAFSEKSVE